MIIVIRPDWLKEAKNQKFVSEFLRFFHRIVYDVYEFLDNYLWNKDKAYTLVPICFLVSNYS